MKQSDLLRRQADMMDMADKYGIDDWRKLVTVDTGFRGERDTLKSIGWLFATSLSNPKFALGVVEGKPVFEGDELYVFDGKYPVTITHKNSDYDGLVYKSKSRFGNQKYECFSWNPPKPKTVMVELLRDDVEHWAGYIKYQSNNHLQSSRLYIACNEALEEADKK